MPRQETVYTVFVASPSDVNPERGRLEDVIRELNATWSRQLGIRLDLIRWETHAYPGFAQDPQDVINQQIPVDFDIFIGIMWHRFGTPTTIAGSGTEEEFTRAKARHDSDPSKMHLLFYFKDAPISPSAINAQQLSKVAEFKQQLGAEGGLYWMFTDTNSFEQFVRVHLSRVVQQLRSNAPPSSPTDPDAPSHATSYAPDIDDTEEESDLGMIELFESVDEEFNELITIMTRLGRSTTSIGMRLNAHAERFTRLMNREKQPSRIAIKRDISKAAKDMNDYAARIDAEIPLFKQHFSQGMTSVSQLLSISTTDFSPTVERKKDIQDTHRVISEIVTNLQTVRGQIATFQEGVSSVPRVSLDLSRAKRQLTNSLDRLLQEWDNALNLVKQAESAFLVALAK